MKNLFVVGSLHLDVVVKVQEFQKKMKQLSEVL